MATFGSLVFMLRSEFLQVTRDSMDLDEISVHPELTLLKVSSQIGPANAKQLSWLMTVAMEDQPHHFVIQISYYCAPIVKHRADHVPHVACTNNP